MKLKYTKPNVVKMLYQIMYDTHKILENNKLNYWIDGGSLLGAVRHKSMIPWDDDVDIGILEDDVKKFLSLEKEFKKCGYSISKVFFGYKIFYSDNPLIDGENFSFPFIDVFPFKKIGNKYKLFYKSARETWPKESWYEGSILCMRFIKSYSL
jgi:phosphorylcholine metabolism protein LicD